MKKIGKILLYMIIFNFIFSSSILGWLGFSLIFPSLEGTGLTVFDLFKKEIEPEKLNKFEENIMIQSKKLGKETGKKITKGLEVLFPSPDFNFSKIPAPEYPYPSVDAILKIQNEQSKIGIKNGLKYLEETEKENKSSLQKGLKILEETQNK